MNSYQIFETDLFLERTQHFLGPQNEKLLVKSRDQIYPQLRSNPYFGRNIKKLTDSKPETWRYRLGDYRIFYEINPSTKLIVLQSFRHRKDAYKPGFCNTKSARRGECRNMLRCERLSTTHCVEPNKLLHKNLQQVSTTNKATCKMRDK